MITHNPPVKASSSHTIEDIATTSETLKTVRAEGGRFRLGDVVLVVERENISFRRRNRSFSASKKLHGLGGNMDYAQKRLHGWRGTTNDIALYARGLWVVTGVRDSDDCYEDILTVKKLTKQSEEQIAFAYKKIANDIDAERVGYYVEETAWDALNRRVA